jgi:hypothetical protein
MQSHLRWAPRMASLAEHHGPSGRQGLIPNGPDPCGRQDVRSAVPATAPAGAGLAAFATAACCRRLLDVNLRGTLRRDCWHCCTPRHGSHKVHVIRAHRTAQRRTRVHGFRTAEIFYPNFYPKRRRGGTEMSYLLVTAANWNDRPECVTSLPSWSCGFDSRRPLRFTGVFTIVG